MTKSNGNPNSIKLDPDDALLFGWLDEETVKQPKKRLRSTSIKKSSKADGSKNITQAKINDIIIATTTTASGNTAISSSFTDDSHRLKTVTPTQLERQEFGKAFPENACHVQQQQQQQQDVANTNSRSSNDDGLEKHLASACNSHFLQFYDANKKKLKKAAHNRGTNNKTPEPPETPEHPEKQNIMMSSDQAPEIQKKSSDKTPEKQKKSSDKALDIASEKGKRLRDMRQERHEQHNQQQQLAVRKKGSEYCRSFDLLPAEPLKHVASYLAAPSRALFDMALNGNMDGPGDNRRGVTGVVDILDFGEIEKSLANKLRDWHLKEILLRIDAVNNLKRLRLTNCVEIKGDGLVPLQGSKIIEQIDLSIVSRWKGWNVRQNIPQILGFKIQFILDSIIERKGCSLKHLQFSKSKVSQPSEQFVSRYTEMLRRRNRRCRFEFRQSQYCLVQERTCYGCLNHFCSSCRSEEQSLNVRSCNGCTRYFCSDCTTSGTCNSSYRLCRKMFCKDCEESLTDCCSSQCGRKVCSDCISANKCNTCKKVFCKDCDGSLTDCCSSQCDYKICSDCISAANKCNTCKKVFCKDCEESLTDCCSSQCDYKICSNCILANKCKTCKKFWCKRCSNRRNVEQYGIDGVERFQSASRGQCASCFRCKSCDDLANPECCCEFCNSYFCDDCFVAEGNGSDGVDSACIRCCAHVAALNCCARCQRADPELFSCEYCVKGLCEDCFQGEGWHPGSFFPSFCVECCNNGNARTTLYGAPICDK